MGQLATFWELYGHVRMWIVGFEKMAGKLAAFENAISLHFFHKSVLVTSSLLPRPVFSYHQL
jgi:hypothetical protein